MLKLPGNLLTNYVGDLLVTQEGFIDSFAKLNLTPNNHLPKLAILHWNGTNFVTRATISRHQSDWFEQVTFAPMDIPPVGQQ